MSVGRTEGEEGTGEVTVRREPVPFGVFLSLSSPSYHLPHSSPLVSGVSRVNDGTEGDERRETPRDRSE